MTRRAVASQGAPGEAVRVSARVAQSPVACACGRTPDRVAAIGTASDHRLPRRAARGLDLATGLADVLSCGALGGDSIGLRFACLVAQGVLRMRRGRECQQECDGGDDFLHGRSSTLGWRRGWQCGTRTGPACLAKACQAAMRLMAGRWSAASGALPVAGRWLAAGPHHGCSSSASRRAPCIATASPSLRPSACPAAPARKSLLARRVWCPCRTLGSPPACGGSFTSPLRSGHGSRVEIRSGTSGN